MNDCITITMDEINADIYAMAETGIEGLITLCGDDYAREGLSATPDRVIRSFIERTKGYHQIPAEILKTVFDERYDEMVVLKDIEFTSTCEHHLLPFFGLATVGYIPNGNVVGLSKLARLVDCFAMRFQVQERMTMQIADALEEHLQTLGVGVIVKAQHQCMTCRGVRKQKAEMVTSVLRGVMRDDAKARQEFLAFV